MAYRIYSVVLTIVRALSHTWQREEFEGFTEPSVLKKHTTQLEELAHLTQLPSRQRAGLAPHSRGSNQNLLRGES